MSATVEIFSEHGIDTTEEEIAQAVRAAFDDFPQLSVTALPHDEAAVYDEAGMVEDVPAYRRKVLQRVGRHVALVEQSVPVAEAAAVLGVSRSRVQQMISARTVWALRGPGGRWLLPSLQLARGQLLPGWSEVARALPEDAHPLEVLGLLTTPQAELAVEGRPATIPEWLLAGGNEQAAADIAGSLTDLGR